MTILIILTFAYILGILFGFWLPTEPSFAIWITLGIVGICSLALKKNTIFALSVIGAVFIFGWLRPLSLESNNIDPPDPAPCLRIIEGTVTDVLQLTSGKTRLRLQITGCSKCIKNKNGSPVNKSTGIVFVSISENKPVDIYKGDIVLAALKITPIHNHQNPGISNKWNNKNYFSSYVKQASSLVIVRSQRTKISFFIEKMRNRLSVFWNKAISHDQAKLARALTLGQSNILSSEQKEQFRKTGTAHLLAVSGLHLGIVVFICFLLSRELLLRIHPLSARFDVARIAAIVTIPIIIIFTLLTGSKPSVVRACTMAVCILTATAAGTRGATKEAVALSALGLLIYNPNNLFDPGFQLSYAAVLGFLFTLKPAQIALIQPDLEISNEKKLFFKYAKIIKQKTKSLFKATLVASVVTTPIVIFHFDRFSAISIPVNMLLIPVVSLVLMPLLLFTTAMALLWQKAAFLIAKPAGYMLAALDKFLNNISQLPCTFTVTDSFSLIAVSIICFSIITFVLRKTKIGYVFFTTGILLLALSMLLFKPVFKTNNLTIDFLDVGQGDSTLITFPNGHKWLIDGGGTAKARIGKDHIAPILTELKIKKLNKLILTHPDPDHVAGLTYIIQKFKVDEIWDNGQGLAETASDSYYSFIRAAAQKNISIKRGSQICGSIFVGNVKVDIIHPCQKNSSYDPGLSFNDNSIVLKLTFQKSSFLLTGDLSADGEIVLIDKNINLSADLLKLGHHGSKSSSSMNFLDSVKPKISVASCGPWNKYGMPHKSVKQKLEKQNISLFRTDIHGAIRAVSDGKIITVYSLVK